MICFMATYLYASERNLASCPLWLHIKVVLPSDWVEDTIHTKILVW